jgi:ornithine cyclodeaminase
VHIKYGYILGDSYYVIKIASGFWKNETFGIPNGQGMMLLFDQKTGQPKAILLDDATLTDIRTAVAGQICAQQFANDVHCIGVLGTGLQARLQVEYLKQVTKCRTVMVWGRNQEKIEQYQLDMEEIGFKVALGESPRQVAQKSNLIITTTASSEPLLFSDDILPGTHITAMGSDTPTKRELGPGLLKSADLVIADSIAQCQERGEIAHALVEGDISNDRIVELGNILSESKPGRTTPEQITVADLTGVAVQDIQIATAVFESYLEKEI